MAQVKTFNVSESKGGRKVQVSLTVGSTPSDSAWQDLNLSEADINNKAIQSVVIDFQGWARRNWARFIAAPQKCADEWAAGLKASSQVVVDGDALSKEEKLTPAQAAYFRSIGVVVPDSAIATAKVAAKK